MFSRKMTTVLDDLPLKGLTVAPANVNVEHLQIGGTVECSNPEAATVHILHLLAFDLLFSAAISCKFIGFTSTFCLKSNV